VVETSTPCCYLYTALALRFSLSSLEVRHLPLKYLTSAGILPKFGSDSNKSNLHHGQLKTLNSGISCYYTVPLPCLANKESLSSSSHRRFRNLIKTVGRIPLDE
jgi:hypothetical protein